MHKRWDSSSWTPRRQRLCRAVYEAAKKEAPYAPMDRVLGPGNTLFRGIDRSRINKPAPDLIHFSTALDAIRITDAGRDNNRFTGFVPASHGQARIQSPRGGLYCSQQTQALMAETYEYSQLPFSTGALKLQERHNAFLPRCFATLKVTGTIDVVNLDSESERQLMFLERLQRDNEVHAALQDLDRIDGGYRDLFHALYHESDYSAARGLGLGLISNSEIHGLQVLSARDYETPVGGSLVRQTGDNVVLFGDDGKAASNLVKVSALHVVDREPSGAVTVTHFEPGSSGLYEARKTETVAD